jgi:hypothetical protein
VKWNDCSGSAQRWCARASVYARPRAENGVVIQNDRLRAMQSEKVSATRRRRPPSHQWTLSGDIADDDPRDTSAKDAAAGRESAIVPSPHAFRCRGRVLTWPFSRSEAQERELRRELAELKSELAKAHAKIQSQTQELQPMTRLVSELQQAERDHKARAPVGAAVRSTQAGVLSRSGTR